MECGDYKGTIEFLDNFNRNTKLYNSIFSIIKSLKKEELESLFKDDIVEVSDSIFIKTTKTQEEVIKLLANIIKEKNSYFNNDKLDIFLSNIILKTTAGFIIKY